MAFSKTQDGVSRPFSITCVPCGKLTEFPAWHIRFVVAQCLIVFSLVACNGANDLAAVSKPPSSTVSAMQTIDIASLDGAVDSRLPAASRSASSKLGPACPFPQHVRHVAGTSLPANRSRGQLDSDVVAAYRDWKKAYLVVVDAGAAWPPVYRVAFGADGPDSSRTVSEGIGYGMLITALMAGEDPLSQEYFDGLWRFARLHPSNVDARMMAWQVPERSSGDAAAFDGDADIALALLMADKQWGSHGDIDYGREARVVIAALHESAIGPDSHLPMLGDWVDPYGDRHNQFTPRSSDLMPASFRAFDAAMPGEGWDRVLGAALAVLEQVQSVFAPETGLLPDFIEHDPAANTAYAFRPAEPGFLEGPKDGSYHYNAGRVPLRLGMDGLMHGGKSLQLLRKLAEFAETMVAGGAEQMGAGYSLDGQVTGNYFTTFFAAPFAVALMSDVKYQQRLDALYDAIRLRREGYYEDSINLLSLLLLTGNFWSISEGCTG